MIIRLTAAALLAAIPAMAIAQATTAAADKPIARSELSAKLDSDYADLDADKNGKATAAEITARLTKSAAAQIEALKKERDAAFARLDTNGDGSVSRAEFDDKAKLPTASDPDAKPFLARFDANKDGAISKDEFRAPTLANFDRADKNKDGMVSEAELKAATSARKPASETPQGR